MEQSAKETWKRLLDRARVRLPEPTLRTWLEPAEAVSLEDGKLVVATPDQFAAEWNESKHSALLSDLSSEVLGKRVEVSFRVQEERAKRPQMDFFVAAPTPGHQPPAAGAAAPWALPLNERYSFTTFVVGKSNELAAAAASAAAIVLFHNHPSGDATPSPDDITLTARMVNAGDVMGIDVVDHLILADQTYYSMLESGRVQLRRALREG